MRRIRLLALSAAAALGATLVSSAPAWADDRPGRARVASFGFFYSDGPAYYPYRFYPPVRGYGRYLGGRYAYAYPRWHRRWHGRALHHWRAHRGQRLPGARLGRHYFPNPQRAGSRRFSRRW